MVESPRFVIIDCYDAEGQLGLQNSGATLANILYKRLIDSLIPNAKLDILNIAFIDAPSIDPTHYDGAFWTGSNLFLSADDPESRRHIDLCHDFFAHGIPQFGSCWAAQLACHTAGGSVEANPLGREFGFIQNIEKTEIGKSHPMLAGKANIYAGFASHRDSITSYPKECEVLARNAHSIQAIDVSYLKGRFWATQYHCEYDYAEIAMLAQTRKQTLINDEVFKDEDSVDLFSKDIKNYQEGIDKKNIENKYNLDPKMLVPSHNAFELRNWLSYFFNIECP